jgi:serine-type D-Ala-D-Ala carboxypeptidase/endopeptidase
MYFSGIRVGMSPLIVPRLPQDNSRLAEIVTRQVERDFRPQGRVGLVVGAIAGNEEVLLGFGSRQLGDARPPDADTVFEIGSITKVFTGILLSQSIESGELELDDRIADLLPEGWTLSEAAQEITLRHCTTHTSGFPRLPENLLGMSGAFRHLFGGDPYRDYGEEAFRDALATVELEFEPGTASSYSNFAVGLLGFALATRNGSDYETLVTTKVCRPLGMDSTVITSGEWQRDQMPAKYRAVLPLGPVSVALGSDDWRIPNHLASAGAIRSTGRDMMTFLKANMGLIPTPMDEAIQRSHQELFREPAGRAMGMNWIRSFDGHIGQDIIWHNGGTGGFRTCLEFTEDRQFGVFVLSNTATGVDDLADEILRALVQEAAPVARSVQRSAFAIP